MVLVGKERAVNLILSTTIIRTSVTVIDLTANISKVPVLEVAKPEPFYGSR
jgi:hypothetical protein